MIYNYLQVLELDHKNRVKSGVYMIYHKTIPGLRYIGQSNNIYSRWKEHLKNPKRSGATALSHAFKNYGKEHFNFMVIELCDNNYLDREVFWIEYLDTLNDGLNLTLRVNSIPKTLKSLGGKTTVAKSRSGLCNTFFNTNSARTAALKAGGARKIWKLTFPNKSSLFCLGTSPLASVAKVNHKSFCNWASSGGTIAYKALKGFSIEALDVNKNLFKKDVVYTEKEFVEKVGEFGEP